MTKTELALKIMSYPPTARIDITTGCSASNFSITALQELIREWKEFATFDGKDKVVTWDGEKLEVHQQGTLVPLPIDGCTIREIPEPDKDVPPDHNC